MSWFDTVKSVAKTVVKTLSDVTGGPSVPQGSFALPYRDGLRRRTRSSSESDSSEDEAAASVARITTRARITYQLDRFAKNAMLIFVQMKSQPPAGSRIEETTTHDLNKLLDTFSSFRFEVNTHIDLTCSQIESKCQEFFQQDFTYYGAVIVVVLTFDGTSGHLSGLDGRFPETIILRHLTDDLNLTLLHKPKIYITEANRRGLVPQQLSLSLEGYQDVLGLHLPTIEHQFMLRRPLFIICENIKNMAGTHDVAAIFKKSVEDIKTEENSAFDDKSIEFINNFTKEMILAN